MRPRLTHGQWHVLYNLEYRDDVARYRKHPVDPVSVFALTGSPIAALLRHGYARLVGDGYIITDAGRTRVHRRGHTFNFLRRLRMTTTPLSVAS